MKIEVTYGEKFTSKTAINFMEKPKEQKKIILTEKDLNILSRIA